jgi:hypothetical protein
MPLTNSLLEQIILWCNSSDTLVDIRSQSRSEYFGYDEPGEIHYIAGTCDINGRERRFLGWFALSYQLPDGKRPAELAVEDLLSGNEFISAIESIRGSRYVLAMIAMVNPGRGLILRLVDEEFSVDNRQLSRSFSRNDAICAHIVPVGRRGWLVGPGWVQWPTRIVPGMQAELKNIQITPIQLERFLQQRKDPNDDRRKADLPQDSSLKAAVARMTKAAKAEGIENLVMTQTQWKRIVLKHMKSSQINDFSKDIVNRVGSVKSIDGVNKWLGLAMNIWNNTPQPDRGGRSPNEIRQEYETESSG